MAYKIYYTDTAATTPITVEDQSLNNVDTSLVFVGKNFPGYSQYIGENFLHLLENFAKNTAPPNPVKGQLWYDTTSNESPPRPQLRIFDGTRWTESNSIKKSTIQPSTITSVPGDLWVDTVAQQLYLFNGTAWVLIGPEFSSTSTSGYRVESLIDRANNSNVTVLSAYVENERVAITSKKEFIPKATVEGFPKINQGITLSVKDFDLDGTVRNKFWGTSEKSNALVVGAQTVPASSFLRNDVVSTTNFSFNIRTQAGINIGQSLETSITSSSSGTIINQNTPGSTIKLRLSDISLGTVDVVTVTANGKVGIGFNKNPTEVLDVAGNILSSGVIKTTNTTLSVGPTTGALVVSGGVGIGENLIVNGPANINNTLTVGASILPTVSVAHDLGNNSVRFRNIYAQDLDVNGTVTATTFVGNITGNVTGSVSQLSSSRSFSIQGDISTPSAVLFNGTNNVVLVTEVQNSIITGQNEVLNSLDTDEFLLYRPVGPNAGLNRTKRTALFSSLGAIPVGGILPYGGDVPPPGYLLCDGSEQSRTVYSALFNIIGFKYKLETQLKGNQTFALPDLRGKFPAGRSEMDNENLMPVTITATGVQRDFIADGQTTGIFTVPQANVLPAGFSFQVGNKVTGTGMQGTEFTIESIQLNSGILTITISADQVQPNISSTDPLDPLTFLTLTAIGQFDASRPIETPIIPGTNIIGNQGGLPSHTLDVQSIASVGTVNTSVAIGQTFSIVNPHVTLNYIIFTGRII